MNFILQFFNVVLYKPLLNILVLLWVYIPGSDFGLAIIVLTLTIKLILHPISLKSLRSQRKLSDLQPKIKEVQNKFKNDKQRQSQAMMELYQKEKINPFSGCLPILLQLVIMIALYQVVLKGFQPEVLQASLYSFVPNSSTLNYSFLWLFNLRHPVFIVVLALITGIAQFFQAKTATPQFAKDKNSAATSFSSIMQTQMLYFFPLLSVFIVWKFGAAVGLYWLTSTLFSIGEQYLVNSKSKIKNKNVHPVK